jgi:hypothetical protein
LLSLRLNPTDNLGVDGETCSSCGAKNRWGALHCWQCFASFSSSRTSRPGSIRGFRPASVYTDYTSRVDRPQDQTALLQGFRSGLVGQLAVALTIALAAWWAFGSSSEGFSFPEQINGAPRIESRALESGEQAVQSVIEMTGLDVQVDYAFYGTELQPEYMMFSATVDEETLDASKPTKCGSEPGSSFCFWVHEDSVVGVGTWSFNERVLRLTADRLRMDLD